MLENGTDICNCKRKQCERLGNCAACIEHHKTHKRYPLPYCQRKLAKLAEKDNNKAERAADRENRKAERSDDRENHKAERSDDRENHKAERSEK